MVTAINYTSKQSTKNSAELFKQTEEEIPSMEVSSSINCKLQRYFSNSAI